MCIPRQKTARTNYSFFAMIKYCSRNVAYTATSSMFMMATAPFVAALATLLSNPLLTSKYEIAFFIIIKL